MKIQRYPENPLIRPEDVTPTFNGWEVLCAFNAGVTEYHGEVLLLMRVAERPVSDSSNEVQVPVLNFKDHESEIKILHFRKDEPGIDLKDPRVITLQDKVYLTTISHLRLARSRDGHHFTVDAKPALFPDQPYEAYGLEDPRITKLGDTYYVVYKGVSSIGILQCLASTKDFVTWQKHGIIFCPENMDGMLFPEKIDGSYAALHRPSPKYIGTPNMWIARSEDLIHWGEHRLLLDTSGGDWEGARVGGGAVPFRTDLGWLEIYHAATPEDHYCLGAILLDKNHPEKLIAKSVNPILKPTASYEIQGLMPHVVFSCGALLHGDTVSIYYGAADTVMAGADLSLSEILDSLESV